MSSTVLRADHGPRGNARTPAADGNDPLGAARPEEFEELFSTILDADFGAVARLHQALETASEWCREHGVRGGAAELDVLAERLTDLGEELHLVREGAGDEIRFRSHRAAAAARTSPAASARDASAGPSAATPTPVPPGPVRPLPRSR
ncbi:hypothetical protein ACFQ7A_28515 [Streptomyces sp. NPDC056528]|uniref:hypothetical protein n=1 Tax=Streptomyces sp. NPDC056528 TaxID=3345854 RepID=UPI0036C3D23E